ncbi:hypothetical protein QFC21_005283 [Naganishia friedmannii]|uniref:Uncharacterized protein n=1 Tax=Naganishia friedmannii TaxID=89922 RepID=A0ACC2VCW8_9TREE|nr:hypothetical protein QFC21_005283 [Naganishia friedmannii]
MCIILQNQLNKTLAYSNSYHFANQVPYDTATTVDSRQSFGSSELRYPSAQATKPTRPMITPTASFRTATSGPAYQTWSAEGSCSTEARHEPQWGTSSSSPHPGHAGGHQHSGMEDVEYQPPPPPPPPATKPDDYSAFEHDAFAPLHTTSSSAPNQSNTVPSDPWAAFRSRPLSAIGNVNGVQHQERPWMQNMNQQSNAWQQQGLVGSTYQKH